MDTILEAAAEAELCKTRGWCNHVIGQVEPVTVEGDSDANAGRVKRNIYCVCGMSSLSHKFITRILGEAAWGSGHRTQRHRNKDGSRTDVCIKDSFHHPFTNWLYLYDTPTVPATSSLTLV